METWSAGRRSVPPSQAIAPSQMALLLASVDYLASDFLRDDELPALRRHRVRLAPALVGDYLWQGIPELPVVQWLDLTDVLITADAVAAGRGCGAEGGQGSNGREHFATRDEQPAQVCGTRRGIGRRCPRLLGVDQPRTPPQWCRLR